jgi:phosphonoacetaldehyde hydrolase
MKQPINAVIFDWAGTTIDYGCFAPLLPFVEAFKRFGLTLTLAEVRAPMGMLKIDHIRELLALNTVKQQFIAQYQREPNLEDIQNIYSIFEQQVFEHLTQFTQPIDGVIETVARLREMGIIIGSTTGYTSQMMEIVVPAAARHGYTPDFWVAADQVKRGRPYPYMIYRNMLELDIPNIRGVVKIGDTTSDILEGLAAGCISVGVIEGSSELGLSKIEFDAMNFASQRDAKLKIRNRMYAAGANYVIDNIQELPDLICALNSCYK